MESFFKTVMDIYHRLLPNTKLLAYEAMCIDAWRISLSSEANSILDAQMKAAYFVQRQAYGAKVCFYYPKETEVPLFCENAPDIHAATITLKSKGGTDMQRMPAKIFIHRGKFFSIEFPKAPVQYMKKHSMQECSLEVDSISIHHEILA